MMRRGRININPRGTLQDDRDTTLASDQGSYGQLNASENDNVESLS
jgi:hypothetical protein